MHVYWLLELLVIIYQEAGNRLGQAIVLTMIISNRAHNQKLLSLIYVLKELPSNMFYCLKRSLTDRRSQSSCVLGT